MRRSADLYNIQQLNINQLYRIRMVNEVNEFLVVGRRQRSQTFQVFILQNYHKILSTHLKYTYFEYSKVTLILMKIPGKA